MSTHKYIDRICVAVLLFTLLLTVLFVNGEALGVQVIVDEDAEIHSDSSWFTANDLNGEWDSSSATVITLSGSSVEVSGSGAYAYDGGVVITNGGTYVLSGTLDDGSIVVDAYASSKVWLLLNGVTIQCADDACLIIDQADKVFLTLAEGTENSFTSGEVYSAEALADNTDGVIFAHDDLTINGSGTLTVSGGWKHGIAANDDLVITGGSICVDAVKDAIHVNDSLRICNASIAVTAGDDGIATSEEGAFLYIESGSLQLDAEDDAIHTAGDIDIVGGKVTISAGDDGIHSDAEVRITAGSITIAECYEGIEAITIDIAGGDIVIYPADDGLNANGGSGDAFGMTGGGHQQGNSGEIGGFNQMPENSESAATEAAVEASAPSDADTRPGGMSDGSGEGTEMGQTPEGGMGLVDGAESAEETETWIHISGGALTIINESAQDADGIDSNGDILISGGVIRVSLVNSGSNSALDFASESGGVCEITGGEIIACGSYSMAEGFDSSSTQCSILYNLSSGAAAGTTVSLEDLSGNVLVSYEVPCSFSSVNLSCPELQLGETYLIVIGEDAEEITLDEVAASYGDAQSSMFGGSMNWGGMQDRGNFGGGEHRRGDSESGGAFNGGDDMTGDRPEPPEGTAMPEMGEAPDFDSMGSAPEQDQMPEPGEMPSGGEPPEMGSAPGMGQMHGMNEEHQGQGENILDGGTESAVSAQNETSMEDWLWFGLSLLVLALGLVFALRFRRHK